MRSLVILLGASALAGCASRESPVPLNSYQPVVNNEITGPPAVAPTDYRISSLDHLRINVFGEEKLSLDDVTIDPDGNLIMPLVGQVKAEGLTTQELSQRLSSALRRYIRQPEVAVNVTEFASRKVTIEGAVKSPGVFQMVNQMTLMDAIALGQGTANYYKSDDIVIFRRQGGQRYVARFDLGAIQTGQAIDPELSPGDVVIVGDDAARRRFGDILALLPPAVGIFIALLPRF